MGLRTVGQRRGAEERIFGHGRPGQGHPVNGGSTEPRLREWLPDGGRRPCYAPASLVLVRLTGTDVQRYGAELKSQT